MCCIGPVTEANGLFPFSAPEPEVFADRTSRTFTPTVCEAFDHQKMVPFCIVEQLFSFLNRCFLNVNGISLLEDTLILLLNLYLPQCGFVVGSLNYVDRSMPL